MATTEHYLKLLRNLTKCSPPESPVIEILSYKSIDYILYELLLNSRSLYLKRELQHNVFQAFNGPQNENMQPSFVVIQKCVKPFLNSLMAMQTEHRHIEHVSGVISTFGSDQRRQLDKLKQAWILERTI